MTTKRQPLRIIFIFSFLIIFICSCSPNTNSLSEEPSTGAVLQIDSINETNSQKSEVTQTKIFNQCDSSSPFEAEIFFADSTEEMNRQELVLKAKIGGEVGFSEIAKVELEAALEQHYVSSKTKGNLHQESVKIEVQPYSKQEYSIVWGENWREGIIEYNENGEKKTAEYTYRVGLELLTSIGKDLPCPTQSDKDDPTSTSDLSQTPPPEITETITATTEPIETKSLDTTPGSVLSVGQTWTQDGLNVNLERMEFTSFNQAILYFSFYNSGDKTKIFHLNENANVEFVDNNGKYYTWDHTYQEDIILEPGESHNERIYKDGPFTGADHFIISMNIPGIIDAKWRYN